MGIKYNNFFAKIFALIIIISGTVLYANGQNRATVTGPKTTFTQHDIFHAAAFLKNNGVVENNTIDSVQYFCLRNNINAYFAPAGVYYRICKVATEIEGESENVHMKVEIDSADKEEGVPVMGTTVRMNWVGSNPNVQIVAGEQREGTYNFLAGENKHLKGVSTVGYKTITYVNLYPGIDVVYTFPEKGGIEYSLLVHPGADISQVKMHYAGTNIGVFLKKDSVGNLVIRTGTGSLVEHMPVSFTDGTHTIPTRFVINGSMVSFKVDGDYDRQATLTVDPWVSALTNLPTDNLGCDVDYDFAGNLYVYGAGPTDDQDASNQFQVVKYNSGGTFLWNFNGTVPAINWTTSTDSATTFYFVLPSNFCVDKASSKVYVGQSLGGQGTTMIRLNSSGAYDNFQSIVDTGFHEIWGIVYNCVASTVLGMGGGVGSIINMGVVNTTTGNVTLSTITGDNTYTQQDILGGTYDSAGTLYVILNSQMQGAPFFEPVLPYTNTIYKVNSTINGNIWAANSRYTAFSEVSNDPFWEPLNPLVGAGGNGNWFNCLSANGRYLFYYDGKHVAAYSLATGTRVGNTTIAANTVLMQSGIAVDNCNNVYVGGVGNIITYSFDGTNFTQQTSIPLGGAFGSAPVIDIKYKSSNNLLYVTGQGFAGTYTATLSTTCNVVNSYTVAATGVCDSATVHISPSGSLSPKLFNIIWSNSSGTIISQLNNTPDTINTIHGLGSGTYTVQVQWNPNCGGNAVTDTVTITCTTVTLTISPDTTICPNQPVMLTATPSVGGGTYLWAPGGATTQSITVTPATTTTYTVTYTPLTGPALTDTVRVTVATQPISVTVNNATECSGAAATLTATPSVTGGTYLWAPGGATTQSITVTPGGTTVYTVTYSTNCGTATNTGTVTIAPAPTIALTQNTTCSSGQNVIYVTGGAGTSPYQYALNNTAYQVADSFTNLVTGTDSVHLKDAAGCIVSAAITLVTVNGSGITLTETPASCAGGDGKIFATTTSGLAPFQFNLNAGAYQAADSFTALNIGFYTVGVKDANGCLNQDTISVTTSNPVTLALTQTAVSCAGNNGKIFATPAGGVTPYQYALNGGAFQLADSFTNLAAGFYTVQVKDANTCAATDTITVTTLPNTVTLSLTATAVSCAGGDGTITAVAGGGTAPYQYALNGGAYQNSGSFTSLNVGFYTVQTQDAQSCIQTDTITVTTTNPQRLTVSVVNPLCSTDSGIITAVGSGGVQPYQYAINGGAYQASGTFGGLTGGTYTIVTEDVNSCTASATATVDPIPAPLVVAPVVTPDSCPGFSDGTITANAGGGTTAYSYNWSNGAPNTGIDAGLPKGTYTVTVTDAHQCTVSGTATIIELPGIAYTASARNIFCLPLQDGFAEVTVDPNSLPVSYLWSNGSRSASIYQLGMGTYGVTITNGAGCKVDTSLVVGNDSAFSLSVFPADTTIQLGNSASISVIPHGDGISFMYWNPSEYLACDTCATTSASPIQTLLYRAFVTSDSGCTAYDSVLVNVIPYYNIYIPNAFTPNGDGNNDYFQVFGEKADWKQFKVAVFDRWGEKVFESTDMNFEWDGRYKGKLMDPQVLVYEIHVTFLNNHTAPLYKGSVTLVR